MIKPGDLVTASSSGDINGLTGLFLEWKTFDEKTNPYTCPMILWEDGKVSSIQYSLLRIISVANA